MLFLKWAVSAMMYALFLALQAAVMAAVPLCAAATRLPYQPILTHEGVTEVVETSHSLRKLLHGCHRIRCAAKNQG